ncbi:MAG TPA: MAPEG family protein [Sphingomonas sp.]|nr:MAPEG family protein [Sphingomonas sp.]
MRIELTLLGATLVLALVQIMAAAHVRTRQYGTKWNVGARDETMPPLDPLAGRLVRAQANLFETLPLFIGAVLAAAAAGRLGGKTEIGAHLYFWGRLAYVPLYAIGVPVVRTIVWGVATFGLVLVIAGLLIG